MTIEINPGARMQLVGLGTGLMHPASCMVCGSGTNELGYVDLGVWFDFEGRMYLCLSCVSQCAETAGMLSIPESQFMQETNKKLADRNAKVEELLGVANERLQHFDAIVRDLTGSSTAAVSIPSDNDAEEQSELPESDPEVTDSDVIAGAEPESEPDESVKGIGHIDANGAASSDFTL